MAQDAAHLDPQLQLLIQRWPTLSKAVQQQIMLLVGLSPHWNGITKGRGR